MAENFCVSTICERGGWVGGGRGGRRDSMLRVRPSVCRESERRNLRVCEISQPTVRHVLAAMMKTRALTSLTVRSRSTVSTWRALGLLVRARSPLDVHAEVLFCSHRFSEAP